jgi:hypothetical protein
MMHDIYMDAQRYLQVTADELHKLKRKKFPRRRLVFDYKDQTWSMDLVEMQEWKASNDGYRYILNVIDGFTRFAFSRALNDKTAPVVFSAFEDIIRESKRTPDHLWCDQGKEFYNKWFTSWLNRDVNSLGKPRTLYSTYGEMKSALVERFNRTMKTEMYKRFTANNNRKWVAMIAPLMHWYNNRKHSTLGGLTPAEASLAKNRDAVALLVSDQSEGPPTAKEDKRVAKFALGDMVRLSRVKGTFEKGYIANYTQEIYTIRSVIRYDDTTTPLLYEVKDFNDKPINGTFYEQELQKTAVGDIRLIESVIKKRTVKGQKQILVKWLGISDKFNQWLPEENIVADLRPAEKAYKVSDVPGTLKFKLSRA